MADKGIIFSAPMVRALLDGRKTQTRRLLKPQPDVSRLSKPFHPEHREDRRWVWMCRDDFPEYSFAADDFTVPYAPGDRLYVREACRAISPDGFSRIEYLADGAHPAIDNNPEAADRWLKLFHYGGEPESRLSGRGRGIPSIHMPRWASRLTLFVTDVRVQRVQEISEEDAVAEGVMNTRLADGRCLWNPDLVGDQAVNTARHAFSELWNSLHTKPGERWEDNPWIVAVTFEVRRGNIDTSSPTARASGRDNRPGEIQHDG